MDSLNGKAPTPDGVVKTRKLPCFIESFSAATAGLPSPEIFRRWSAIGVVGALLERRCWTASAMSVVFPNTYILLVAPPGVGKSMAIREAQHIVERTRKVSVAPDDVTKASLIDALAASHRVFTVPPKFMTEFHSMFVGADELGVLLPAHDLEFLNTLNVLYDNRPRYKETRRHREKDLILDKPQLNILAGTQPDYLGTLLPDAAWGMGFMTRIMMIYAGSSVKPKLFGAKMKIDTKDLQHDANQMVELYGEYTWTNEAEVFLTEWYESGLGPVPDHSKLKHYNARRVLHVLKLAMISSASRRNDLVVDVYDVERAKVWLIEAESLMPEIFKDMSGKSDGAIIGDLHYYVYDWWVQHNHKLIHRSKIDLFLMNRTPAYNVENVMRLAISSGVLIDKGADLFEPGSITEEKYAGT
jgi:hypothetical protein